MAEKPQKAALYVALGYVALSLMWFFMAGTLVDILTWDEFVQLMQGRGEMRGIIGLVLAAGLVHVLLAFGAWRALSLSRGLRYGLLTLCIAIPACLFISDIGGLPAIYFRQPAMRPDMYEISSSLEVAMMYLLQALMLIRVFRMASRSASCAQNT